MRILSLVAMAALVVSGTAKAADEAVAQPPALPKTVPADHVEEQPEKVGTPMQTSGKIVSMHACKLVGVTDPHVLVKIQTEDGDTDIVDLGTAADLKSSGIEAREGQCLWVSGRIGRINDKELLVAENLSESKLVTIVRTAPLREETEKHAAARGEDKDAATARDSKDVASAKYDKDVASAKDGKEAKTVNVDAGMQVRTVEGAVIHTRNLKIEGEAEEHVFCKLQTEDGIVVVDLGNKTALPKVDLSEGQAVAVTGFVGHCNTKPIIVADSVGNMSSIKNEVAPAKKPVPEK